LSSFGVDPACTIVATGHQAAIWHPGILAKDIAVRAIHECLSSDARPTVPLHYVADHDANDVGLVRLPVWSTDDAMLGAVAWRLRPPADGRSTRDRPPGPASAPPSAVLGSIRQLPIDGLAERIVAIRAAVDRHVDAPSLAMQFAAATADLARPFTGDIERRSMSSLLQAPIGHALLDRMRSDPDACIDAHDAAIEADRDARGSGRRRPRGVARLLRRGESAELPLWRDTPDGRRPVLVEERPPIESLRPRALLATALARLAGCDLFVHGVGGGIYDRVMEDWLKRWLGPGIADALAPSLVASATLRLPLPMQAIDAPITPEDLHRLRNDPDLASVASTTRATCLAAIDAAPRRSSERRAAYLALRSAVEEARRRGAAVLSEAERSMDEQRRQAASNAVARDRTWAFPLHATAALERLGDRITQSFAGSFTGPFTQG
jgi:hypothetical protein